MRIIKNSFENRLVDLIIDESKDGFIDLERIALFNRTFIDRLLECNFLVASTAGLQLRYKVAPEVLLRYKVVPENLRLID